MYINPDEPAFFVSDRNLVPDRSIGLTKKEYIAAMAMQGILSNSNGCIFHIQAPENLDVVARLSLSYADALINELNKEQ